MASTHSSAPVLQRPSASTALWAHLLRKDVSALAPNSSATPTSGTLYPSIAPVDKNGTSMRILLLDTAHNLEKFSARVDNLTVKVDETKTEMVAVHKLFQDEHEKLTNDIVDIVNRCQTEIQRSMGTPAQANKLEELQKDLSSTDRRIEALDKRIDLLHTLHQTQAETLQIQARALQSQFQALQDIQNQQGNMISALSPLLPLLQAVPLQIETARSSITENLLRVRPCQDDSSLPDLVRMSSPEPQTESRSSSTLQSGVPPSSTIAMSPRKRPRLEFEQSPRLRDSAQTKADSSPLVLSRRTSALLLKHPEYPAQYNHHTSAQDSPPPPLSTVSPSLAHRNQDPLKTPSRHASGTPRRPLGDLLLSTPNPISSFTRIKDRILSSAPSGDALAHCRQSTTLLSSSATVSSIPECPPRDVQMQASNSGIAASPILKHSEQLGVNSFRRKQVHLQHRVNAPSATSKPTMPFPEFNFEPQVESGRVSIPNNRKDGNSRHTQVSRFTRAMPHCRPEDPSQQPNHPFNVPFLDSAELDVVLNNPTLPTTVGKPMSIKDRKAHGLLAQVTSRNEGKRFIPLDDDEDDDPT